MTTYAMKKLAMGAALAMGSVTGSMLLATPAAAQTCPGGQTQGPGNCTDPTPPEEDPTPDPVIIPGQGGQGGTGIGVGVGVGVGTGGNATSDANSSSNSDSKATANVGDITVGGGQGGQGGVGMGGQGGSATGGAGGSVNNSGNLNLADGAVRGGQGGTSNSDSNSVSNATGGSVGNTTATGGSVGNTTATGGNSSASNGAQTTTVGGQSTNVQGGGASVGATTQNTTYAPTTVYKHKEAANAGNTTVINSTICGKGFSASVGTVGLTLGGGATGTDETCMRDYQNRQIKMQVLQTAIEHGQFRVAAVALQATDDKNLQQALKNPDAGIASLFDREAQAEAPAPTAMAVPPQAIVVGGGNYQAEGAGRVQATPQPKR